jgi:anti-anti-sigma regulatory factor
MLNRKVQATNGRLALCQLTPAVLATLESIRLMELFTICATEEEALQSFS